MVVVVVMVATEEHRQIDAIVKKSRIQETPTLSMCVDNSIVSKNKPAAQAAGQTLHNATHKVITCLSVFPFEREKYLPKVLKSVIECLNLSNIIKYNKL